MKKEKFITSDKLIQKFRVFFLQRFISFFVKETNASQFLGFFQYQSGLIYNKGAKYSVKSTNQSSSGANSTASSHINNRSLVAHAHGQGEARQKLTHFADRGTSFGVHVSGTRLHSR